MSLGYVKGRYWVPDTRFDLYAQRDSFKRLLRSIRQAEYFVEISYSYTAQRYTADILTHERFARSANLYIVHHNNAYDPNPLAAAVKAITAYERCTPLIRAICLEIECELLKDALSTARRVEAGIETVLEDLERLLLPLAVLSEAAYRFGESYEEASARYLDDRHDQARPIPAAPGEDDDL